MKTPKTKDSKILSFFNLLNKYESAVKEYPNNRDNFIKLSAQINKEKEKVPMHYRVLVNRVFFKYM